jgi:COP9 signalosome complex subunit 1
MEPLPSSDLDTYASRYYGRGKIWRLQHIASQSTKLRKEALLLAIAETKAETRDVDLYKRLVEQLRETEGDKGNIPLLQGEWETTVMREDSKEVERLETELQRYRHNMIKDSIRMAYGDLGDFQYSKGNLEEALRNYLKMRDYCISSQQITDMCLKVIQCAIILGNYSLVESYVQKAEQTPDISTDEPPH